MIIELILFLALAVLGLIGIILNDQLNRMNRHLANIREEQVYMRDEVRELRRQKSYEYKYVETTELLKIEKLKLQEEKKAHGELCTKYGMLRAELEKLKPKVKGGRKR